MLIQIFLFFIGRIPLPCSQGVGLCGTPVGRCCAPRLAACTYYPSRERLQAAVGAAVHARKELQQALKVYTVSAFFEAYCQLM
jgi:hypothetical protein